MARPPSPLFEDRRAAGRALASRLAGLAGRADVLVLALPRGGVPVAYEVAAALGAPLDVFLVRKLGVPGHEELAMGAIAGGGALVRNEDVIRALSIDDSIVEAVARRERQELLRRELAYRRRPAEDPAGRTVVLVDDGLATGSSMRAAIAALRTLGPARVVVAVPVAPEGACEALAHEVDDIVCAETPAPFIAVGQAYADFRQTTDDEVRDLVAAAAQWTGPAGSGQAAGPARTPGS